MTPPTFRIGDQVEIIGPSVSGQTNDIGHKFTIWQMHDGGKFYTNGQEYNYPASSLRLVEELKIGDLVRVSGSSGTYTIVNFDQIGNAVLASDHTKFMKNINDLRKLSPEEMQPIKVIPTAEDNAKRLDAHREEMDAANERLSVIEKKLKQLDGENDKLIGDYREGLIREDDQDKRLAAIEKRQNEAREYSDNLYKITEKLAERIYDLQKRLEFVEAFQKDEATHAAYTTYTYKPGEEGTITVHCSCGQKHEIDARPHGFTDDERLRKRILHGD